MAPAEVTHDSSGWPERKKTRGGNEVWVSSTSTNQFSHSGHRVFRISIRPTVHANWMRYRPDGGRPARTSTLETPASLRENAPYRLGKYAMNRASRPRPMAASVNISPMVARLRPWANPRVRRADPDSVNANESGPFPRAQYIAV